MDQAPLADTWSFIDAIARSKTSLEVEDVLFKLAGSFGFTSAFGGIIPATVTSPQDLIDLILVQKLPEQWSQRYRLKNYLFRDPILKRLQADCETPFTWQEAYDTSGEKEDVKLIGGEAADFGLKGGIVIPVEMLDRCPVAVSFGGASVALSDEDFKALRFATTYAIGQIFYHRAGETISFPRLSSRELDCLMWAAEGKSDWETGMILGISAATVEKHMLAVRTKLCAVNRGHAIAKALRLQIIH